MKFTTPLGMAVLSACVFFSSSLAHAAERIKFSPKTVSTVVSGSLQGFKGKNSYVIKLRAGQKLEIHQTPGSKHPITISVADPKGNSIDDWAADCHSNHSSVTELSGDYRIYVTECMKADPWKGQYSFSLTAI